MQTWDPFLDFFLKKFSEKSKFSPKIEIFVKSPNFRQKSKFSSKMYYFSLRQLFSSKIEIFV